MIKMTHLFKLRVDYSFSKQIFQLWNIKKICMKIIGRFFCYYVTYKGWFQPVYFWTKSRPFKTKIKRQSLIINLFLNHHNWIKRDYRIFKTRIYSSLVLNDWLAFRQLPAWPPAPCPPSRECWHRQSSSGRAQPRSSQGDACWRYRRWCLRTFIIS